MSPAPLRTKTKCRPLPPPPPTTPKILLFPRCRRTRRKQSKLTTHPHPPLLLDHKGKLGNLFYQENNDSPTIQKPPLDFWNSNFNASVVERREKVEGPEEQDYYHRCNGGGFEVEKWRFQAEILQAECNFLRLEREFALKKLAKNRIKMETTLRSAVHTLVSGRARTFEGKNVNAVSVEEIEDLVEKLQELQKSLRIKDHCSSLETKACREEINWPTDLQELIDQSRISLNISPDMDQQSSCSITNCDEPIIHDNKCSGRCKAVIRRIVEQVRTETEQWSQMQEMLRQVHGEMEELHASRDFWESRAQNSDYEIQILRHSVQEWKEKALVYEDEAKELKVELSALKEEVKNAKTEPFAMQDFPLENQLEKENILMSHHHVNLKLEENKERLPNKDLATLSLGKRLSMEMKKRMILDRLKEKSPGKMERRTKSWSNTAMERSPLRDIENSTT